MPNPLPTKPGINGANVLSIPTEWDATWFRKFINNSLKGADVRNAIAGAGITITGNISSPYATISATGGGGAVTQIIAGSGIGVSPAGGTGAVTVSNTGVTQIIAGTGVTISPAGGTGAVTVSSSGGVAEPFNITPDTHGTLPTGVGLGPNDEFESGSSIDTTGSRYAGATAWTGLNVGTGATAIVNSVSQGSLILQGGATQVGASTVKAYVQPFSGQVTYQAKIFGFATGSSSTAGYGIVLNESATGKCVVFNILMVSGVPSLFLQTFSSPTVSVANLANLSLAPTATDGGTVYAYMYLQIVVGATTIACSYSRSGVIGTFQQINSFTTTAQFTVGPDRIGLSINPDSYGAGISPPTTIAPFGVYDWFRRTA
jgi:hypothetical protein